MHIVLIILLFLLVYTWLVYPVLLVILSRNRTKYEINAKGDVEGPAVVILFAAHNEEKVIRRRLENLVRTRSQKSATSAKATAAGEYGSRIWVGIDGSTDNTASIAREFASLHENIHVEEFKERRGKVAVLKDLVRKSREESNRGLTQINADESSDSLLVFTDANTVFRLDALEKLLMPFSDPYVGGVCGRLEFWGKAEVRSQKSEVGESCSPCLPLSVTSFQSSPSEGFYWRWENQLKVMESRIDSCLGANGAIYAVRNNLFPVNIPENTIVDDFVIGMQIRQKGYRMLYEPEAVAEEEFPVESDEWCRRVRIGAGDFQALSLCLRCLLPQYGAFAWQFCSHKVLRWFTPHLLLLLVAGSLFLVGKEGGCSAGYLPIVVLAGTVVFVLVSGIGRLIGPSAENSVLRFFRMCNYFFKMNAALFVGSLRFFAGDLKGYWERTPRG